MVAIVPRFPNLTHGCGTIFEYVPSTRSYSILYSFTNGADGDYPILGGVAPGGSLYGATEYRGSKVFQAHPGALFTLTPGSNGYTFAVLSQMIDRNRGGAVLNPPARSENGTLVGAVTGGIYSYQNGKYTVTYNLPGDSFGQFFVPKGDPNSIISTAVDNGSGVGCTIIYGCGFIFFGHY